MPRHTSLLILALMLAPVACGKEFSGARALEYTRKVVSFGPRPPASPAIHRLQAYLQQELKLQGAEVIADDFTAKTPNGTVAMKNIIGRFPGKSGRAIVFTGHYDTKLMPGFVGANDGGSSTGFLLEMAAALHGQTRKDDVYLVWFDGEEAFHEWSETDSLYGSRHLAEKWSKNGMASRIKALINVDMIGDKDLDVVDESNSAASVRRLVWDTADAMGYGRYFLRQPSAIGDDHVPFLQQGVRALDVIDLNYGPNNEYWHTSKDTMDKLSPHSFQVVGAVLTKALETLEASR